MKLTMLTLTLSTPWMQAHVGTIVQVWWRSSHVCGRSSDLRVKVYNQTDRRMTDASRLHKLIPWNELKITTQIVSFEYFHNSKSI